jgi:hypothetical protein
MSTPAEKATEAVSEILNPTVETPFGDALLMVGGVLFVASLFAYFVLGIGNENQAGYFANAHDPNAQRG